MELARNASQNDIKKKYRELTKIYHPDRNNNSQEANIMTQKLNIITPRFLQLNN
jgi:DnaJ-class molecular chaperone